VFYRLLAIDGRTLPAPIVIGDTEYHVVHGGLLLKPPRESGHTFTEGFGIIKFFGSVSGDTVEFIGSSSEHYRWPAPGVLDFSRADSTVGSHFSGVLVADKLELVAEAPSGSVRVETRLELVASPDSPIPAAWDRTFDFGPPWIQVVDPVSLQPVDPALLPAEVISAMHESIRASEPARQREAASRLEVAWRAPV
jgi:hypothetical protein